MGIRVDGLGGLIDDMQIMLGNAESDGILEAGAQPIVDQMRQNAASFIHVRSGDLQGAIGVKAYRGNSATIGIHRSDWSSEKYYPAYVEFGHGGPHPAPPHPFIRPAVDAKADEAMNLITVLLRQALG